MKKLNKLKLLLSAFLICSGIIPLFGVTITKDNINYNVNTTTNTAEVTGPTSKNLVIENLVIPDKVEYNGIQYPVTSISSSAFEECYGLTGSLTIGNSIQSIGSTAFRYCLGLKQVYITDLEAWCNIEFTNIESNPLYCAHHLYLKGTEITNLEIPSTITEIKNYTFCGGNGIVGSLTIPESVTSIGKGAFHGCSGLTGTLTIPESVTSIGNSAFCDCSGFTSLLTIPASVTLIDHGAFWKCSGFTGSLTVPENVTSIGENAFASCTGFDGSLTIGNSVQSIGLQAFNNCSGFKGSLTIGNSVRSIGSYAFWNCSGFTGSLTIPESVQSIGQSAFEKCSGFTGSLTIPNSVQTIGQNAFENCSGFKGSLIIGNSVTSIGSSAFEGCSGFTGPLSIPNSVTYIGSWAFGKCSGFNGSLTIGNSVQTIGSSAFEGCSGFNGSLTIGNSVQTIGSSAFRNCSGFNGSLTIPGSVTSIENSAFYNCSGFTGSLIIGNSVQSIGNYAFSGCSGLTGTMYSLNPTPPECQSLPPKIKTVYVPFGSKTVYQKPGYWRNYTIMELPEGMQGSLKVADFAINAAENKQVDIDFVGKLNNNTYSGFQFDITLPQGISVSSIALNESLSADGFSLSNTSTANNKIRVVGFNSTGKASELTEGILTLTVTAAANAPHGQSQITISKASFSNILGQDLDLSDSQTTVTINNVPVSGFIFTPKDEQDIYVGQVCSFTASVTPDNATNKNFTWKLENEQDGYVSIEKDENGEITVKGLKLGTATISITAQDFEAYSTTVTVNVVPTPADEVVVSAENLILLEGTTSQLTATVKPEDTTDQTITWSSDTEGVATVSTGGLVTAVKAGQATITASCGDAKGTCIVTVKAIDDITVNPGDGATEGDEDQNPGENTQDGMAVVGDNLILRVGQTGTVNLTITPDVNYDPALVWTLGTNGNTYVEMTVADDNTTTATFKGLAVGETTYSVSTPANSAEVLSGKITIIATNPVMSLTVEPQAISLPKNALAYELKATITPETVTTPTLYWESSQTAIATVDPDGNVTPVGEGECDITVSTTDGTGLTAVCHVTITQPIDDNFEFDFDDEVMGDAESISIYLGDSYQFVPKAQEGYVLPDNITWSSSDPTKVSVDNDGTVHGLQLGEAVITATATVNGQKVTATCTVKVIPVPAKTITINGNGVVSIKRKETLTLTATVLPTNTTYPAVTWQTSAADIATVTQEGVVTGQQPGNVTITAYVTEYPDVLDTYELEITDLLLGDSNDNGIVSVADVVTTANHIIEMPVAAWSFVNADVTQDNEISMADVTGTVEIILNDLEETSLSRARAFAPQLTSDFLVSGNFMNDQRAARIDVKLENSIPYSALQATVLLPEGMEITDVVGGPRLSDHMLLYNQPAEGVVKVVIFSLLNTEFEATGDALFTLVANTGNVIGNIQMTNIFGSDAHTNEYELSFMGGLNESDTTGLQALYGDSVVVRTVAEGVEVYNAEGLALNVYRYTGETVASIPQASSYEKVSLVPGLYVIKAGNTTAKIVVK